jgi:hypothetical protein
MEVDRYARLLTMEQQGQSKTNAQSQDVFISYCTEDRKVAEAIKAFLVSRGVSCWKTPEDVAPGADWPESISQAIQLGRVFVLVWSAASMDSEEVFRELSLASRHHLAIVPVRLEAVEPKEGWDYFLVATQWLDAFPSPPEEHFEKACDRIKIIVRGPSDPQTNDAAYQLSTVLKADSCNTFQGAKLILDRIVVSRISDPDLAALVAYCRELVDFCIAVGIPRDAEAYMNSPLKMFWAIDKLQLCHAIFTRGPFYILATAFRLRKLNLEYPSRVAQIVGRYGLRH